MAPRKSKTVKIPPSAPMAQAVSEYHRQTRQPRTTRFIQKGRAGNLWSMDKELQWGPRPASPWPMDMAVISRGLLLYIATEITKVRTNGYMRRKCPGHATVERRWSESASAG